MLHYCLCGEMLYACIICVYYIQGSQIPFQNVQSTHLYCSRILCYNSILWPFAVSGELI